MIETLPEPTQAKLWPSRPLNEQRVWVRELLATHGRLSTTELAVMVGANAHLLGRKLLAMEDDRMIKPVAVNEQGVKGRGEFTWALRCHPAPCIRSKSNDQSPQP